MGRKQPDLDLHGGILLMLISIKAILAFADLLLCVGAQSGSLQDQLHETPPTS